MSFRASRKTIATAAAVLAVAGAAYADPPGRVARISFISGAVSFRPASFDEWSAATLNYPLTIGDHVWTDARARTELELGALTVRIAPSTEVSVLNLDDLIAQLRLTEGALSVRVRALNPGDVIEIDTPNGAVTLDKPGLYRVDVNSTGDSTTVTARRGEAEVAAGGSAFSVRDAQSAVVTGLDAPQTSMNAAVGIDEFEDWCLTRDRRADAAQSARYVSPDVIGYADLDQYGGWQQAPEYGAVWLPRVRADWVPYRFGRWAWVEPWGWTWVDEAPWGFAPFHYGRWVRLPAGWAWVPGRIVARPVYAPALVAFVGGDGWRASAAVGEPVAWFPLGPREVFVPAYRVSPVYATAVNRPHVEIVNVNVNVATVRYVNRDVPGAVTAVPREIFVRAEPIAATAIAVPREAVQASVVIAAGAGVQPQRANPAGGAVRVAAPPPSVFNRRVVMKNQPPPAASPAPTAVDAARALARPAPPSPAVKSAPETPAPPAVKSAPQAASPPAVRSAPPRPDLAARQAEIAARHAEERRAIDARHAAERARLQSQHQQAEQHATDAKARQQLHQQHQAEMQALQERHRQEREAVQKRQTEEKQKG